MTNTPPGMGTNSNSGSGGTNLPSSSASAPPPVPPLTDTGDDVAAEIEKWKQLARKHEDRAKANADASKELEKLRQQTMSDVEKAAAVAKAEGRAEALKETGAKLVVAEVRAAAAGRPVDIDALLEGLDTSRFLDADGDPDVKAIAAWVDRIAPKSDESKQVFDLGQGHRPDSSTALNDNDPLLRDLKAKLGIN